MAVPGGLRGAVCGNLGRAAYWKGPAALKGPGCQVRRGGAGSRRVGSQVRALGCGVGLGTAAPQRHPQKARREHLGKGVLGSEELGSALGRLRQVAACRQVACTGEELVKC